ncbi:hypothetical protein [Pedobacter ureilyticus]|jgi:hypothetical protein|uniref:Uncharacterized protein n=1 Tax=Pedobacter ureilyticus TaxID=1393051 RepID=A0ABW9J2X4_9SPHI|nr:hypothetical protein [Pedobacter helvus]
MSIGYLEFIDNDSFLVGRMLVFWIKHIHFDRNLSSEELKGSGAKSFD